MPRKNFTISCLPVICLLAAFGLGKTGRAQAPPGMRPATSTNRALDAVMVFADLWQRSLAAEKSEKYEEALSLVGQFEAANGDRFLAEMRKGWLHSLAGNHAASLISYGEAVKANSKSVNARKGILVAQTALGDEAGMFNAAIQVLELDPADYQARMTVAAAYFNRRDWKNATPYLGQLSSLYPMDIDALAMSTLTLININQKPMALELGGRLAILLPGYATASDIGKQIHDVIGTELDQLKPAEEDWARSIAAETAKDYGAALQANHEFARAGGDRYLASMREAWIYRSGDKPAEALKFYQHAALMKPNAVIPRKAIHEVASLLGNGPEITRSVRDLLKVDPANYAVPKAEAARLFEEKNYRKSGALFANLRDAYPMDTELLSYLGWSLYYLSKTRDSKEQFINLYTLAPDYADAEKGLRLGLGLPLYEPF